jgi:transposase
VLQIVCLYYGECPEFTTRSNRDLFNTYVETQLAPALKRGDVVVLDNLSGHKSPHAAQVLESVGAWFLFLPSYSPDLNLIEMAFSRLKTLIRKQAARSYDALWQAVGHVCDLFSEEECYNYFKAAGYVICSPSYLRS